MKSDVDLLGITAKGTIEKNKPKRGVSLHEYPLEYLKERSRAGDLFLLHIIREGIPLSDPLELHKQLNEDFTYKSDYLSEKSEAAAILWFCKEYSLEANEEKLRKRIVWSLRTLIIADAAERQKPIFSAKCLEKYSGIKGLKDIIDHRNTIPVEVLFKISRQACAKYHKLIRPRVLNKPGAIQKWMKNKGKIAAQTSSYLGITEEWESEIGFYN